MPLTVRRSHQAFHFGAEHPADSTMDALKANGRCGDTSAGGATMATAGGCDDEAATSTTRCTVSLEPLRDTVTSNA